MEVNTSQLTVVKSNTLIDEANYKLTLNAKKLILFAISTLDSSSDDALEKTLEIAAADYAQMFDLKIQTAYQSLSESASAIMTSYITIPLENGKYQQRNWMEYINYDIGGGRVVLKFDKEVAKGLSNLKSCFTKYSLKMISNFSSCYSVRLYELMKQYAKIGRRSINFDELAERLMLSGSYARIDNFKARILNPSIKEINRDTDIVVTYTSKKSGKKITGFDFKIGVKEKLVGISEVLDHELEGETIDDTVTRIALAKLGHRTPDGKDGFDFEILPREDQDLMMAS